MVFQVSDGFNIRYQQESWPVSENVLFVHGNLASCEWWEPTLAALKDQPGDEGLGTLLSADWRGYGLSRGMKSAAEIDFSRFAADYIELIEKLELSRVNIVGHSTGGMIAMLAILQRPDLFKSLVLLDSVGARGLELQFPLTQVLAHFDLLSKDRSYFERVLATTIKGVDVESEHFRKILNVTWGCDRVAWVSVPEHLSTKIDFTDRLAELRLPTLILHGEEDLVLPATGSEKLHRQIGGSKLKILRGRGHSYNLEAPVEFASELREFWA